METMLITGAMKSFGSAFQLLLQRRRIEFKVEATVK
jgi:hypothetical protein